MKKNKNIENKCASGYYDSELYKMMEAMSDKEMISCLKELEDTRSWIAISKYTMDRIVVAQNSLNVLDPVKNPTEIARAQGIISGLMDLHSMLVAIKENDKKKADGKTQSEYDSSDPGYSIN